MFDKILIVCVGNICRSPMGERKLKQLLPNKHINSAGIGVSQSHLDGKPANDTACRTAMYYNLSLENHKAQQLTQSLCHEHDLILVMEKGHMDVISAQFPEVRGKIMLFGQWIGNQDIPDPYRKSQEAFDYAFDLIDKAAQAWATKLA